MRTRFAPSPTGFLHIGGVRTALFAWLQARKTNGSFLVRIEDTDKAREVSGAVENILKTLAWAGLSPDEGVILGDEDKIVERGSFGPYIQSKRVSLYRKYADELLAKKQAYHCFCTSERLDEMRKTQEARHQAPMYDRTCQDLSPEEITRRIAAGEKYVVRMKVPREETINYQDEIYGKLSFKGHTVDDQILLKSDGLPTYHLAHVVDDHLMEIDMIIRGEEWLSSLPKHLLLFRFLGWQPPKYAHVPLLLNADRSKLSKRQNDVSADHYIEKGYLPEALINFLVLLGWNPGTEQEIFSIAELIQAFSLGRVQKSGAVFDLQKLDWLQGQWMRKIPLEDFIARIKPLVSAKFSGAETDPKFAEKAALIQARITFFPEAPEMLAFFYEAPAVSKTLLINPKQGVAEDDLPKLMGLIETTLEEIPENRWDLENLKKSVEKVLAKEKLKRGQLLWPLRAALTGREYSPGAYEVVALLGRKETLARLKRVV
jgi:nondiscriminating glutamyl-tRNA synthetase